MIKIRHIWVTALMIQCLASAGTPGIEMAKTQSASLRNKAVNWQRQHQADRTHTEKWAAEHGLAVKSDRASGGVIELMNVEQDRLVYNQTFDYNAAMTVSADRVWSGGGSGLNLTGKGMIIGIWDGDGVLTSHREFGGRVIQRDEPAKAGNHSTHVAGTMIAAGISLAAKGVSPDAILYAHDWYNDTAEMAREAADGLLLSNHSYGHSIGWAYNIYGDNRWVWFGNASINPTDDYYFGLYTSTSRLYDDIAYDAPYYLIIKSAGNDRLDNGPPAGTEYWYYKNYYMAKSTEYRQPDGPWDCIPDDAVGKNILTIGAIDEIVDGQFSPQAIAAKMTSFSSWGPVDDGRIKPDLVTDGMGIYSTIATGDDQYASLDGTSMAAPTATGSLALLQQHYQSTHDGQYMLAHTLKALVLHTARESGAADGPDYSAGWGLLDVEAAAALISQDVDNPTCLRELALDQGQIDTTTVYADGTQPLKVTVCWTDPPGEPVYACNPTKSMLVNDLDLRVFRSVSQETTLPWKLDRNNPSAPAIRGDNSVDNVEQVYIPTPAPGRYRIAVSHKGTLQNGRQAFAMIVSGSIIPTPSLTLTVHVVGNGSVSKDEDRPAYLPGDQVQVTAHPMPGWHFSGWSGDLNGSENPQAIFLDGAKTITALFQSDRRPLINSRLEFVDNAAAPDNADEGILTLKVTAFSTDHLAHAIRLFEGSFCLDAEFCSQVREVDFSEPFFPPSSYTQRMEEYGQPHNLSISGRIFYSYAQSSGSPLSIDDQPAPITLVHIRYQRTNLHGQISMEGSSSDFKVRDEYDCDITGSVEPLPLDFQSIALPVEVNRFSASPSGRSVLLIWSTLSETANLGFNLLRAETAAGPYGPINRQLIAGAGTTLTERHYRYEDRQVETGKTYFYKLADIGLDGYETLHDPVSITLAVPNGLNLEGNYPNPFNPSTRITFTLSQEMPVTLTIHNVQGQLVRRLIDGRITSGRHELIWDGHDDLDTPVPAGIYYYTLTGAGLSQSRRMLLLK